LKGNQVPGKTDPNWDGIYAWGGSYVFQDFYATRNGLFDLFAWIGAHASFGKQISAVQNQGYIGGESNGPLICKRSMKDLQQLILLMDSCGLVAQLPFLIRTGRCGQ